MSTLQMLNAIWLDFNWNLLGSSVLYSIVGIVILVVTFVIIEKLTPRHNLWKEVVENHNTALAIVAGFFMIAIAIIIASAIH
jgi:putative membrane protein